MTLDVDHNNKLANSSHPSLAGKKCNNLKNMKTLKGMTS
jgi:hypothetical protein